jgi:NADP-dependent 3-hydroxy acid dehydrogenase YdfG
LVSTNALLASLQPHLKLKPLKIAVISPGETESELADSISAEGAGDAMKEFRRIAIPSEAIGRAIAFASEQPDDVDVNEIIVRPTASPY